MTHSTKIYILLITTISMMWNVTISAQGVEILSSGSIKNVSTPVDDQDAVTKGYIDSLFISLGLALGGDAIQRLLNLGYEPLDIVSNGVPIDSLYSRTYQGGLIFYLDVLDTLPDVKGMVAAPVDQSTGAGWGCDTTSIPGSAGTAIGTGNQNTIDIEAGCATDSIAADICANLDFNGFTDWFLPSKDELNLMWENLHRFGCSLDDSTCLTALGVFAGSLYWSSSEFDDSNAWGQNFDRGFKFNTFKFNDNTVRAIRVF